MCAVAIEWTLDISLGNILTLVTLLVTGLSLFFGLRERVAVSERANVEVCKDVDLLFRKLDREIEKVESRIREIERRWTERRSSD